MDNIHFKFILPTSMSVEDVSKMVSIVNKKDTLIEAFATVAQLKSFINATSVTYEIINDKSLKLGHSYFNTNTYNIYPDYEEYVKIMENYANNYPNICTLIQAGKSVEGREILFLRITDNPQIQENEPEFMYSSSIHGNETAGYALMLKLIDTLITGYVVNPEMKELVDAMEIWINPVANPDGMFMNSITYCQRFNALGIDLNRNFPDPEDGKHPDNQPTQPETQAMMDVFHENNFTLSANFHSGTEVVNYPWDTWQKKHPDNEWFEYISRIYAGAANQEDNNYFNGSLFNNGVTNGYEWYPLAGGRQDYMTYFANGREVTIEITKDFVSSDSMVDVLWNYNKKAMLLFMRQALYGIHGLVTDEETGKPILAKVEILDHDKDNSWIYTDIDVGDFHRLLRPGTYNIKISADQYLPKFIDNVIVKDSEVSFIQVELNRLSNDIILPTDQLVKLYPIPASTHLSISLHQRTFNNTSINIFDLNGRLIATYTASVGEYNVSIPLNQFDNGLFVLSFNLDGIEIKRKFLVVKH